MWRREVRAARFYNNGDGQAVCVVAAVNYHNGELFDWAAYIGIGPSDTEEQCKEVVREHGCKLSSNDAQYYFPHLPMENWRP